MTNKLCFQRLIICISFVALNSNKAEIQSHLFSVDVSPMSPLHAAFYKSAICHRISEPFKMRAQHLHVILFEKHHGVLHASCADHFAGTLSSVNDNILLCYSCWWHFQRLFEWCWTPWVQKRNRYNNNTMWFGVNDYSGSFQLGGYFCRFPLCFYQCDKMWKNYPEIF